MNKGASVFGCNIDNDARAKLEEEISGRFHRPLRSLPLADI